MELLLITTAEYRMMRPTTAAIFAGIKNGWLAIARGIVCSEPGAPSRGADHRADF
jgi:hypothetical protein